MCLYRLARKINIYNRCPSQFTYADTIATYSFIIALIIIIYFYTYKYIDIVKLHLELCERSNSDYNCLKSEFINVIVPYIGILFGFTQTLYIASDKIGLFFNYVLCCVYCCKKDKNPNIHSISENTETNEIELSRF